MDEAYQHFLSCLTGKQWKRIGVKKRAGVALPLFSVYSKESIGIGEFPDLKLIIDWSKSVGLSIIQMLPLNDVGFDFRPYDAQSTIAFDPMYLSLEQLVEVDIRSYQDQINALRKNFPADRKKVNYRIKKAKLELLRIIFTHCGSKKSSRFEAYVQANRNWLKDYALFKSIQEEFDYSGWDSWPDEFKYRDEHAIDKYMEGHYQQINFQEWLQWQIYEQFSSVKQYAEKQKVFLMGDFPFLVSRNSADVWAHQNYFKLDLASGAPPDPYYANGQRWGMPPYRWEEIERDGYAYLVKKLQYADRFFDLYRIDHFVGLFRVWAISISEPPEHEGMRGFFDPPEECVWNDHGRNIISVMIGNSKMLPCGEDLGTIPMCSFQTLEEYGIPGMDVQRWSRDWNKTYDFKAPELYRKHSIATISTHDMSSFLGWWEFEAGTADEILFRRKCSEKGIPFDQIKEALFDIKKSKHGRLRWRKEINSVDRLLEVLGKSYDQVWNLADIYKGTVDEKEKFLKFLGIPTMPKKKDYPELVRRAFERAHEASSIFSIQLLQDWLSLADLGISDLWEFRINFPGTMSDRNWTMVIPASLEDLLISPVNPTVLKINRDSGRI
ncbi:MAG: 4-alpha-glucanotransferase [Omnitrophica bacterium RIFCSPLOWO2_12_FULL_44_17]|uniref:4-alpha-glucanotransferase n=1 Tax=Candidatus Danuiimicrobium aquiferis TaxID=1801832 RepID=A0A1G1KT45_9BACT|nr:MAG: 4-alpha-glucanotransferase [Omnitrophica bacterium RIFCSPHIGHO2_02_FULL_45_28]OGW91951.1 MAG: 4-alpha-glucanotransferase [Omnitrophica bacterium RIFCSPHIGHO2_12_FULL_44_12]OGW96134.1 MAG: 4-alpha-glucanotransferase [Omnitrophica bacterium RIFCSPLOWO2_12_FULL_44_17]OGX01764.1 MAG: 4-alpha-glucanotransferase [Omnitrophica bacterium RIFCSPLOWO2_02_FULL_44_11]